MARTITIDRIPETDKNEWGYPSKEKYIFRGVVKSRTRWEVIEDKE